MDRSDGSGWLPLSRRSALGTLAGAIGIGTAGCLFDNDDEPDDPDGGNESMSPEPPDTDHPIGDRQGIQAIDLMSDRRRYRGYHVDAGIKVSVGSGDLGTEDTLSVSAGRYFVAGDPRDLTSSVSVGITEQPSPGSARWDVVHGTENGIEVTEGTEEGTRPSDAQQRGVERPASPQVSGTVLAWVWVSSESGTITDDDVIDRRLFGHSKPAKSEPHRLVSQTPTGAERGDRGLYQHNTDAPLDPPLAAEKWRVTDTRLFPRRLDERFGGRTNPRQILRFGEGLYGLFVQSTPRDHELEDDPELANQTGSLLFSRDLVSWTDPPANPILGNNTEDWHGARTLGEALIWDDSREQWAGLMSATLGKIDTVPGVRGVGVGFNDDLTRGEWTYPAENPVITVDDIGEWIPGSGDRVYLRGLQKRDGAWYAWINAGGGDEYATGILRSDDLLNWTEIDSNPILVADQGWETDMVAIQGPIEWNGRWYTAYRSGWERVGIAHADELDQKWEKADGPVLDAADTHWHGFEGPCLVPFGNTWAILMSVYEDEGRERGSLGMAQASLAGDVIPDPITLDNEARSYVLYDDFGDGRFETDRIPTLPADVQATIPRPAWTVESGSATAETVETGDGMADTTALVFPDGADTSLVTTPSTLSEGSFELEFRVREPMDTAEGGGLQLGPLYESNDERYRLQLTDAQPEGSSPSIRLTKHEGGTMEDLITGEWDLNDEIHTIRLERGPPGEFQVFYDGESVGFHKTETFLPDHDTLRIASFSDTPAVEIRRVSVR